MTVIDDTIRELTQQNGRPPTQQELVDECRPEDHPAHGSFGWDDRIAAQKWRAREASRLV